MLQWALQIYQRINSINSNAAPPRTGLPSRTRVGRARGSPRDANWRRAPLSCQKTKASSSAFPRGSGVYSGGEAPHPASVVRSCSPLQGGSRRGRRPSEPRFALGLRTAEPQPPYGVIRPHLPWIRGALVARTRVASGSARGKNWLFWYGHVLRVTWHRPSRMGLRGGGEALWNIRPLFFTTLWLTVLSHIGAQTAVQL